MRNMRPLTEDEILSLIREQDKKRGTPAYMDLREFLPGLYEFAPLGQAHCNTKQCAEILNLRLLREGIEKDEMYTDASVRQKVFWGTSQLEKVKKELLKENPEVTDEEVFQSIYDAPNGTAALFPLTEEEQQYVFGGTIGNQHWFLVKDALTVRLTKPRKVVVQEEQQPKKRGRPQIREPRTTPKRDRRGRPPSTFEGQVRELTEKLNQYRLDHNIEGMEQAIQELSQLQTWKIS